MYVTDPQSHSQAVGTFLRAYREQHGLTLEAVAIAGRRFGASWGTASIRNLEAGKGADRLPTMILLALALNRLTNDKLTLADLLGTTENITPPVMPNTIAPQRSWLDGVLSGKPVVLRGRDWGEEWTREQWKQASRHISRSMEEAPPGMSVDLMEQLEIQEETLAEQRAASKLGILTFSLKAWAHHLWGRSLEEEAVARAEERAAASGRPVTAQARGAMTRQLIDEISTGLNARRESLNHGKHPAAPER